MYFKENKTMSHNVSVYAKSPDDCRSFWKSLEDRMPEGWIFTLKSFEDAIDSNIYDQCILFDATLKEMTSLIHFQRTFKLPFVYVGDRFKSHELLDVLRLGARDILCNLENTEEIKAKIIYQFSPIKQKEQYNEHETIIEKAQLTKVEERIFRVIIQKEVVTTTQNIFNIVWKGKSVQTKTFNVHISKLRKKLKELNLDIRYSNFDKTYHVIKKRTLEEHAFPLNRYLSENYCSQ